MSNAVRVVIVGIGILRWELGVLLLALGSSQLLAQQANVGVPASERRVALVIGNAAYKEGRLANPVNDARAMTSRLRTLGFDVLLRENLKLREIGSVYREFRSKITPGGVALVFYAGHGIQIKGQNYFPVVDSEIASEDDVPLQSLNLGNLLDTMEEAKAGVSLVLLDACRDNPYARRFRSATRGLAKVEAASGTLIHYATKPGSVASDGSGKNGTYTAALLAQIGEPNVPVEQMLKRVTNRVVAETKGKQEPWVEGSLRGDFYFIFKGPTTVQVQPSATAPDPAAIELSFWDSIKTGNNRADFEEYLRQFPQGKFAGLAKNRLEAAPTQIATTGPSSAALAPATQQRPSAPLLGSVALRAQGTYPSKDLRHAAFLEVSRAIADTSGGAVKIEPLPAGAVVPAFGALDAVRNKVLEAAWISPGFSFGKNHAFALVEGVPFGLDPGNYAAWRSNKQVDEIVERLYRQHGVVGLACGVTAPHGDIWVKKPITKLEDFRGLKIRVIGLQIAMFAKVGALVNAIPMGEIGSAMERGLLDAAIALDPQSDLGYGLSDVSKVYMVGQIYGARGLDLIINTSIWDGLQPDARNAITNACRSNMTKMVAESTRIASEAIREMQKTVKLYRLPDSVSSGLRRAWNEVRSEEMAKNATFSELAATMAAYDSAVQRPNLSAYGLNKP